MGFGAATTWWVIAGALVAVELATGTFYLLMLALGAAAGALAAHLGMGNSAQLALAALAGGCTTGLWHWHNRRRSVDAPDASANPDVNLDVGESVDVGNWDEQGRTQVNYRGSQWRARFVGDGTPAPGPHRIAALRGNLLELVKA
jgi:membrane protein implicated in regulation of membrane protease activity